MSRIERDDIRKTDIKLINGDKWKFDFRENGYVIVSDITTIKKGTKDEVVWRVGLHGTNLESCLQYVWTTYNGNVEAIDYKELEDV